MIVRACLAKSWVSCLHLFTWTRFSFLYLSPCWLWTVQFQFPGLLFLNCVSRCGSNALTFASSSTPLVWLALLLSLLDLFWPFLFLTILLWQMWWFLVFDPSLIQWLILLCPLVFPEGELVDCQGSLMIPWGQTVTASCTQAPWLPEGPFAGYSANWG